MMPPNFVVVNSVTESDPFNPIRKTQKRIFVSDPDGVFISYIYKKNIPVEGFYCVPRAYPFVCTSRSKGTFLNIETGEVEHRKPCNFFFVYHSGEQKRKQMSLKHIDLLFTFKMINRTIRIIVTDMASLKTTELYFENLYSLEMIKTKDCAAIVLRFLQDSEKECFTYIFNRNMEVDKLPNFTISDCSYETNTFTYIQVDKPGIRFLCKDFQIHDSWRKFVEDNPYKRVLFKS